MHRRRPTVLLTGFGPFPGIPENATSRLVPELAHIARRVFPTHRFEPIVLPTEWDGAPTRLIQIYAELRPTVAVHFGVSSRARGFELETRGHNRTTCAPDAKGQLPAEPYLRRDGPDLRRGCLPVGLILARLHRRGIPAALSRDAGSYLCNALLYHSLDHAARMQPELRAGFIHLPAGLGDTTLPLRSQPCLLDWQQALAGGLEIIAASIRAATPLRTDNAGNVRGGALAIRRASPRAHRSGPGRSVSSPRRYRASW